MKRSFPSPRRLPRTIALFGLTLGAATPIWAQNAANAVTDAASDAASGLASGAAIPTARAGTPSFLSAIDTTLRLWSGLFQKLGIYALIALALFASYLTGLVVYQLLFASGSFAPRAASTAAWVGALVLLFFGLMMLPPTWPWWAPYALVLMGLLLIAVLISLRSKKVV